MLANLYLHHLDLRWHRAGGPRERYNARLVRYADDFVVLARYIGEPIQRFLSELLEGRMGLTLNREKTRILDLREPGRSLDFLGFTFRCEPSKYGGTYVKVFPSDRSLKRRRDEVKSLTTRRSAKSLPEVVAELNRQNLDWVPYYRYGHPYEAFSELDCYTRMRLLRFAHTRSQRPMRPPAGVTPYAWFAELGLIRLASPAVRAKPRKRAAYSTRR